jgi:hypothetical protein
LKDLFENIRVIERRRDPHFLFMKMRRYVMRAKSIQSSWPSIALALGLALGAVISATTLARADVASGQVQPPTVRTADNQQAGTDFVCHAQPGGWCDLRDWSGIDRGPATLQSQLPN